MAGSRWVKLDTGYGRNPKVRSVSPAARLLHVGSICHCADQLTDGQIADSSLTVVSQIADIGDRWARRRASELVDAGLWIPTETGWLLHDFEAMNPQAMRAAVEAQRKRWRDRQAGHRP